MPSASSAAPGQPSSGAAGKTASSTTPTSTTRSNAFSTNTFRRLPNGEEVDTGQLIPLRCDVPREVVETKLGVHWVRTTQETSTRRCETLRHISTSPPPLSVHNDRGYHTPN